jgi:shikimate 5-dehydrogenase
MKIPPLVTPGPALTVDEVRRYSRHLIIPDLAMAGQQRLMNAKVLCVGAGGLGSPALMYLAAAGVGTIGIVEFDTVDESNLQRQIIHGQSDIGKSKALSAKEKIAEINPFVNVITHELRLDISNVMEIFSIDVTHNELAFMRQSLDLVTVSGKDAKFLATLQVKIEGELMQIEQMKQAEEQKKREDLQQALTQEIS